MMLADFEKPRTADPCEWSSEIKFCARALGPNRINVEGESEWVRNFVRVFAAQHDDCDDSYYLVPRSHHMIDDAEARMFCDLVFAGRTPSAAARRVVQARRK